MKYFYFLLIFCIISRPVLYVQNNMMPDVVLSSFIITQNSSEQSGQLYYQIVDDDTDMFEVSLLIYDSNGTQLAESNITELQGDIGTVVSPGDKFISFSFNTATPASVKLIVRDYNAPTIADLVNQVSIQNLTDNLTFLTGIRHSTAGAAHLEETKDWIMQGLLANNYTVDLESFTSGNYDALNIIGNNNCAIDDNTVYIVDAHYDTVINSPGADDNGSGVAGFMEIARVLSGLCFQNQIRFIGFDQEEPGLIGSLHYVGNYLDTLETIGGVFNFEMIGYYTETANTQDFPVGFEILFPNQTEWLIQNNYAGNFITNIGDETSTLLNAKFDSCAHLYVPALNMVSLIAPPYSAITADFYRSDHAPFMFADYPALFITDSANFRNNNYHTPNDVLSTVNYEFMSNVVKATLATLCDMAGYLGGSIAESAVTEFTAIDTPSSELLNIFPTFLNQQNGYELLIENANQVAVKLYDLNGQLVSNYLADNQSKSLSNLPKGIYLIELLPTNSGVSQSRKLIIQ